jgi:esterase/lipase superfamily enzyme
MTQRAAYVLAAAALVLGAAAIWYGAVGAGRSISVAAEPPSGRQAVTLAPSPDTLRSDGTASSARRDTLDGRRATDTGRVPAPVVAHPNEGGRLGMGQARGLSASRGGTSGTSGALSPLVLDLDRLAVTDAPDVAASLSDTSFTVVPVYFGTDRAASGLKQPEAYFGRTRGRELTLGRAEVSVPHRHRPGDLDSPSWRRLQFRKDQSKHIVLVSLTPLDSAAWTADYSAALTNSPSRQALVFIHGYNVSFEDAARRTAQLAYDLGIDGPAAFFSWPSRGAFQFYAADEASVERSVPFLARFMTNFVMRSDPGRLNVIAHSMGNRALASYLRNLHGGRAKPRISNVILAAPDIDAEVFETQIAPALASQARRVTLYASADDKALMASEKVHAYRRAGDAGDSIVVVPGIETIDATGIDTDMLGHGYFAQNKAVLDDLFMLLKHDLPARSRNLRERLKGETPFWAFRRP